MNDETHATKQRRRGIYLLPNLFTTVGLFAGFYAIIASTKGRFELAAVAIFVAMITDSLDGRIARLTNTTSDFGKEYDSLSDMVAFGLAPALVMYEWVLTDLGKLGWFASFVYAAGAALRLARFNVQHGVINKRYFQGLASPAAAALIASMIWVGDDYGVRGEKPIAFAAMILTVTAAMLMVSNIRYRSFKDFDLKGKVPFLTVLLLVLGFAFISIDPPQVLFAISFLYAFSGPVMTLVQLNQRRRRRKSIATIRHAKDKEEHPPTP